MNNEPVAWMDDFGNVFEMENKLFYIPLYTHPAKTLTLTDDEVMNLWNEVSSHPADFARAILRKAQEK